MVGRFFLVAVLVFGVGVDVLAAPGKPCSLKQVLIEKIREHQFETERTFEEYLDSFPPSFHDRVLALGEDSHWLDAGAGEGLAITGYLSRYVGPLASVRIRDRAGRLLPVADFLVRRYATLTALANRPYHARASVTGVTLKRHGTASLGSHWVTPDSFIGRLRFLTGRFFLDVPAAELGVADLITDFYGVFSYSPEIDKVLGRYFDLLADGGSAFILFAEERNHVTLPDGRKIPFAEWIRSLGSPHLRVVTENKESILVIEKKPGISWRFPALTLVEVETGSPPRRTYVIPGAPSRTR